MKPKTVWFVVSAVGLTLVGAIVAIGVNMASNADFAKTYVKDQLSQQHIMFGSLETLTDAEKESACLRQYAGRLITTGKEAECYANEFIGLHVKDVAKGQTYADLGVQFVALTAKVAAAQASADPTLPDLQKQLATLNAVRGTLFQGETSRGLLLTSFGFSDLGAKAGQASGVAFAVAAVLSLLSVGGLIMGLRAPRESATATEASTAARDEQLIGI